MGYEEAKQNSFYQELIKKTLNILTLVSSNMSYIVTEILKIEEATIESFLKEKQELHNYKKTLDEIMRQREHILSEQEEVLLSEASEALQTPSQTFSMLNNADLKFPMIKDENGEDVELTHGRYIRFLESTDRSVREAAFKAMYDTFEIGRAHV